MKILYNDNDSFCCAWLSNLMDAGEIRPGVISDRSIQDLSPSDVEDFNIVHFFAGVGGWEYAFKLANYESNRVTWTGSCPCQPFSAAGKRQGVNDKRHLWPEMRRLVAECAPPVVFGEQVASKDGRLWLAGVRTDLEALGYAVGAGDLCAAGVGAPHIRQRLYWVADSLRNRNGSTAADCDQSKSTIIEIDGSSSRACVTVGERRTFSGVADSDQGQRRGITDRQGRIINGTQTGWVEGNRELEPSGTDGGLADADGGSKGHRGLQRSGEHGQQPQDGGAGERVEHVDQRAAWSSGVFISCADGKARRIESSIQPLAHGVPNRVGTLRGAGNAIVPQVAAEFVSAYLDTLN